MSGIPTMRGTVVLLTVLALACGGVAAAGDRYEDALADMTGEAPDIVAVTVSEPEGPLVSFSVELASEPPLIATEAYTDLLAIAMDTHPEVTLPELDGYSISTLGATLADELQTGGYLLAANELFWRVVDVDVDGPVITFSVDRKLLGDPTHLHFRVFAITLRNEPAGDEIDHYPEEGELPAVYTLSEAWD